MTQLIAFKNFCGRFSPECQIDLGVLWWLAPVARAEWMKLLMGAELAGEKFAYGAREIVMKMDCKLQRLGVLSIAKQNPAARFLAEEQPTDPDSARFLIKASELEDLPARAKVFDSTDGSLIAAAGQAGWLMCLGDMSYDKVNFGVSVFPVLGLGRICASEVRTGRIMLVQAEEGADKFRILPIRNGTQAKKPLIQIGYRMPFRPIFHNFLQRLEERAFIVPPGPCGAGLVDAASGRIDGYVEDRVKAVDVAAGFSHLQVAGRWLDLYTRDEDGRRTLFPALTLECLREKIVSFQTGNEHAREVLEKTWAETMLPDAQ